MLGLQDLCVPLLSALSPWECTAMRQEFCLSRTKLSQNDTKEPEMALNSSLLAQGGLSPSGGSFLCSEIVGESRAPGKK